MLTPGQTDIPGGGPTVRCANPRGLAGHTAYCSGTDLAVGSYAGSAGVDLIECLFATSSCNFINNAWSYNYVDTAKGEHQNHHCDDRVTIVGCYESTDSFSLGHGDITVEVCSKFTPCKDYDPQGVKYVMHIYQMEQIVGPAAYYTEIGEPDYNHSTEPDPRDYQQCEYAGKPGTSACGTEPADWLWKNPTPGEYKCSGTPSQLEGAGIRAYAFGMSKPYYQACYPITWT